MEAKVILTIPNQIITVIGEASVQSRSPALTLYSQRDPRWRDAALGNSTIGNAGCYVTCVAMVASLAGYADTPPEVAERLRQVRALEGAQLLRPERIPQAYPALCWDGAIHWRQRSADLDRLRAELERGPVILEVEFRPGGAPPPTDQHFVLALRFAEGEQDLAIADPWDGAETRLLQRYARQDWNLARAVYGARLLRVRE